MKEQLHHSITFATAEVMLVVMESQYRLGLADPDAMMRRLKDLSAYSLSREEIIYQREGVELLALGMFFGMTSYPQLQQNRIRLWLLSEEATKYKGRSEVIEWEITKRKEKTIKRSQAESA